MKRKSKQIYFSFDQVKNKFAGFGGLKIFYNILYFLFFEGTYLKIIKNINFLGTCDFLQHIHQSRERPNSPNFGSWTQKNKKIYMIPAGMVPVFENCKKY